MYKNKLSFTGERDGDRKERRMEMEKKEDDKEKKEVEKDKNLKHSSQEISKYFHSEEFIGYSPLQPRKGSRLVE